MKTKLLFETFLDDLKKEGFLILEEFRKKIRGSINDLKNEIRHLRTDFLLEVERFKENLRR